MYLTSWGYILTKRKDSNIRSVGHGSIFPEPIQSNLKLAGVKANS